MMSGINIYISLLLCIAQLSGSYQGEGKDSGEINKDIHIDGLRCESKENPLGIGLKNPRFSWELSSGLKDQKQIAYQVIVASDTDRLSHEKGDLWNSGRVNSAKSFQVIYSGKPLCSSRKYFWKLRIWDGKGRPTPWSHPSSFETGLLDKEDWQGRWINDGKGTPAETEDFYKDDPAPLFRKSFNVKDKVKKARLYISGLGYYVPYMNGKRIGDYELDPGWTSYKKRVFYSTYDVTDNFKMGENCLGVMLGNGWYNPLPILMWGSRNLRETLAIGRPSFICQLYIEKEDGTSQTIVSDNTWKVHDGPIVRNNIYLGEVYDARREIKGWNEPGMEDDTWANASFSKDKLGDLQAESQPPIKITEVISAVKLTEPKPGIFIYDMGQNFAGWIHLSVKASRGARITLTYGELLYKDGTLNPMTSVCGQIKGKRKDKSGNLVNIGGPGSPEIACQVDEYIAKGEGIEEYTPRFTFHGFRYVEVSGLETAPDIGMCKGLRLNSRVDPVGEFSCSDTLLNSIQKMCERTFLSNIFSVQSDCPHRERFGYGGDMVATSEAFIYNFDMADFYEKTVNDFNDAALQNGDFTDTAPFVGIQYCGIGWAMVHPLLQLQLFRYYGNRQLIENQYSSAKKWIDLVTKENPDFIIHSGLSDHESLTENPPDVMVTPLYYQSVMIMEELAKIMGYNKDAEKYRDLGAKISKAYTDQFLDKTTGKVGNGTQGSQSFALYTGIIPKNWKDKVLEYLVHDIRKNNNGHLSTGIMGTKFMLDELSENGYHQLAAQIVRQTDYPGWGYMLANGATTLWEHWAYDNNTYSHNHPMFGSVSQWFYEWLGGIQPAAGAEGMNPVMIRPETHCPIKWVKCTYHSINGPIISDWTKLDGRLVMNIDIPVGVTAWVNFPTSDIDNIKNDGNSLAGSEGVSNCRVTDGAVSCRVVSGKYTFIINNYHDE